MAGIVGTTDEPSTSCGDALITRIAANAACWLRAKPSGARTSTRPQKKALEETAISTRAVNLAPCRELGRNRHLAFSISRKKLRESLDDSDAASRLSLF